MAQVQMRYTADIYEGKLEFQEWVLRSTSRRRVYMGLELRPPARVNYWVQKIKGVTWVKRSKAHFDWGFAQNIPEIYRRARLATSDQIGRPTKLGALLKFRAHTNVMLKKYGPDPDPDFPGEDGYGSELKTIDRAIARLRSKARG